MAGLSLSLVAVVVAVGWAALAPDPYVAAPPGAAAPLAQGPDVAGAGEALVRLEQAVHRRDPGAAAALAAPGTAAVDLLPALARNARRIDLDDFSLRYVDEAGAVDVRGGWRADVSLTWRLGGYDRRTARAEVSAGFRVDGDRVLLTGLGGEGARTPVWLSGPVRVATSPRTLVLARAGEPARRYQRQAQRAVTVVGRVLRRWRGPLVVEVPAGEAGLDAALAAEPGTYAAIAAVTAPVDGRPAGSPVHVLLNPEVYGRLEPRGAQVVMNHEAVHVATRAPASTTPLWLLEGFADYVALRDVDLPFSTTASQVIAQVRDEGLPDSLPGPREFDTGGAHLGAAYEAAWLACLTLEARGGEEALVRLYDRVDGGTPLAVALREDLGWTRADLLDAWRERLRGLAG